MENELVPTQQEQLNNEIVQLTDMLNVYDEELCSKIDQIEGTLLALKTHAIEGNDDPQLKRLQDEYDSLTNRVFDIVDLKSRLPRAKTSKEVYEGEPHQWDFHTFLHRMKTDKAFFEQQNFECGLLAMAKDVAQQKLFELHTFCDGSLDRPLYNETSAKMDMEDEQD